MCVSSNKRILFIFYDLSKFAGIQRVISQTANLLARNHINVEILLVGNVAPLCFQIHPLIKISYLGQNEIWSNGGINHIFYRIKNFIFLFYNLWRFCANKNFDLIVDHGTTFGLLYPLGTFKSAKFYLFRHFSLEGYNGSSIWAQLARWAWPRKRIIVLSDTIKREYTNFGFKRVFVIPNFIDDEDCKITSIKKRSIESLSGSYSLTIARNSPQKGLDILLRAIKFKYDRSQSNINHIIIGEDIASDDKVKSQIEKLGLTGRVVLREPVKNISSLISGASYLSVSSRYEGLPMVVLEALASGIPVVSTPFASARDIIRCGINGFLSIDYSAEALSGAMLNAERSDFLGDKSLQNRCVDSVSKFSSLRVFELWKKLLEHDK